MHRRKLLLHKSICALGYRRRRAASFPSLNEFISVVLTTSEGLMFLMIGNMVGRRAVADPVLAHRGVVSAPA
jgi:hypothetical protein